LRAAFYFSFTSIALFFLDRGWSNPVLCHGGSASCSLKQHVVVAWDAFQTHMFADVTDVAMRSQRLDLILSLD